MPPREEFVALLDSQTLRKGDIAFVMQGDGLSRAARAAQLVRDGFAPRAAIVGNATDRSYGSFPSGEVRDEMLRLGLSAEKILFEETAPHTRAEAARAMELAKSQGWKTVLIVTSPHHQYRAFLTFLKAMRDAGLELSLVDAVAPLPLDEPLPWGTRRGLLPQEFDRIDAYQKKGDVASYEDGVAYLEKNL